MRKTVAVILALALLTRLRAKHKAAVADSTADIWRHGGGGSRNNGNTFGRAPQGWEAELFPMEDGTQQLALKDEKGRLGTVTVYRDDGDTYGRLTEDHMLWLFPEDLHEAVCTAAEKCSYAGFEYSSKNREYAEPKTRGYSVAAFISCNLTAGWSVPR